MSGSIGFIGAIMLLATIVAPKIRTSTAQESANGDCWTNFFDCTGNTSSILQCCPFIQEAISDDRPCFCTIQDVVGDNATRASALASVLTLCGEAPTLDTLCPDGVGSAPTPSANVLPSPSPSPSPPGSDSSPPPLPSPTSTNLSPTETPAPLPPTEESGTCISRITDCINATTASELASDCCPLIKQEIANERECFCTLKDFIRQNPSSATVFTQLFFKTCSVPGSMDTLCPGGPPLSISTTPSDEDSPTSPNIDALFPPPEDTISNDDNVNGSSKIAVSVGLLLFINMIISMFIV